MTPTATDSKGGAKAPTDAQPAFLSSDPIVAEFTKACQATAGPKADERVKVVLDSLMAHLHSFIKEVNLTSEEWLLACNALASAGKITDDKRNEFILISDVLGIESLVDSLAHTAVEGDKATSTAILGPFFREGAPRLAKDADIVKDHSTKNAQGQTGEKAYMFGSVKDAQGKPIAGVTIDVWHDAVNGYYEQQDPEQPDYNCRGNFTTERDGSYGFQCLKPVAYPIPYDNTAGAILSKLDRSPMRPAHIHFFVQAPGYKSLITQVSRVGNRQQDACADQPSTLVCPADL